MVAARGGRGVGWRRRRRRHGDDAVVLGHAVFLGNIHPRRWVAKVLAFVVPRFVLREHPPTHLGRGHHGVCFTCLAVIIGQRPNISKEI